MLIHLSPRLYVGGVPPDLCALLDLRIDALDLHLRNGKELVVRKPYPNKDYLVACRKTGQKAINGIFVESPESLSSFTLVARWAMGAETVATHQVQYVVLDTDFDAVTDNMMLWNGLIGDSQDFQSRLPEELVGCAPVKWQPRMDLHPELGRAGEVVDTISEEGIITERKEVFSLPTVERERLLGKFASTLRLPALEDAFVSQATR